MHWPSAVAEAPSQLSAHAADSHSSSACTLPAQPLPLSLRMIAIQPETLSWRSESDVPTSTIGPHAASVAFESARHDMHAEGVAASVSYQGAQALDWGLPESMQSP